MVHSDMCKDYWYNGRHQSTTQEGITLCVVGENVGTTGIAAVGGIHRNQDRDERHDEENGGRPVNEAVRECSQIEFRGQGWRFRYT